MRRDRDFTSRESCINAVRIESVESLVDMNLNSIAKYDQYYKSLNSFYILFILYRKYLKVLKTNALFSSLKVCFIQYQATNFDQIYSNVNFDIFKFTKNSNKIIIKKLI
jgi:hypothetical protein